MIKRLQIVINEWEERNLKVSTCITNGLKNIITMVQILHWSTCHKGR